MTTMTSVSLAKGGNVNLSKAVPNLKEVDIALGWDARTTSGAPFDLDASAFILGATGRVRTDADFVFYNNLTGANGAVQHSGDNRDGSAAKDDEVIHVNLERMPADVERVAFPVTIYQGTQRRQNFGQVRNAYIRIVNKADNAEIARYDLTEDSAAETAMTFGELYRHGGDWKFKAVGQGFNGGLQPLAESYGVQIGQGE